MTHEYLKLITPPTEEPVSLPEFCTHARIDATDAEKDDITGKILAARVHVEDLTNRALCTSSWGLYLRGWPGCVNWWGGGYLPSSALSGRVIPIPRDTESVTGITYTDTSGVTSTVDPATYEVDLLAGEILLADGCAWPLANLKKANPICISLTRGKAAKDVKQTLKAAIELLAAHWYRNREAVTIGRTTVESMPLKMAVEALVTPEILWRL